MGRGVKKVKKPIKEQKMVLVILLSNIFIAFFRDWINHSGYAVLYE